MQDYYLSVADKEQQHNTIADTLSSLGSDSRMTLLFCKQENYGSIDVPDSELAYAEFSSSDAGTHVFDFLKARSLVVPECHFSFYWGRSSRYRIFLYLCSYITVYRIDSDSYRVSVNIPSAGVREVTSWISVITTTITCTPEKFLKELSFVFKQHVNSACFQFEGFSNLASILK